MLYNFTGSSGGAGPYAGLIRDSKGTLYGTGYYGGTSDYGVVFKLDSSGAETVLYNFTEGADGGYPLGALVRDKAGNLYGTASSGGDTACSSGCGTVFKVDTNGSETVLHSFTGGTTDGCNPIGGLLRDKAGNLYGTTNSCGASNYGTVFKVDTSGSETVLHSFTGSDGAYPYLTGLLMDKKGNLYGVTENGGTSFAGVLYELSKSGTLTVLHSFAGKTTDGCYPSGTPLMDTKGNLYGTAEGCGSSSDGIVWKVSKKGTETVLHNFAGGASDGQYPFAGVIMDGKGNLYGDTEEGGAARLQGTVYKLSKKGKLTLLYSFGESDGEYPYGGLIRDAKGNVYGTTRAGGSGGYGTVWKLTP